MKNNFPCKCGHTLKDHHGNQGCWVCAIIGKWYNCEKAFIPDNLKYLESKHEHQTKV